MRISFVPLNPALKESAKVMATSVVRDAVDADKSSAHWLFWITPDPPGVPAIPRVPESSIRLKTFNAGKEPPPRAGFVMPGGAKEANTPRNAAGPAVSVKWNVKVPEEPLPAFGDTETLLGTGRGPYVNVPEMGGAQ